MSIRYHFTGIFPCLQSFFQNSFQHPPQKFFCPPRPPSTFWLEKASFFGNLQGKRAFAAWAPSSRPPGRGPQGYPCGSAFLQGKGWGFRLRAGHRPRGLHIPRSAQVWAELAHSVARPLQTEPAALGFGLVPPAGGVGGFRPAGRVSFSTMRKKPNGPGHHLLPLRGNSPWNRRGRLTGI